MSLEMCQQEIYRLYAVGKPTPQRSISISNPTWIKNIGSIDENQYNNKNNNNNNNHNRSV